MVAAELLALQKQLISRGLLELGHSALEHTAHPRGSSLGVGQNLAMGAAHPSPVPFLRIRTDCGPPVQGGGW